MQTKRKRLRVVEKTEIVAKAKENKQSLDDVEITSLKKDAPRKSAIPIPVTSKVLSKKSVVDVKQTMDIATPQEFGGLSRLSRSSTLHFFYLDDDPASADKLDMQLLVLEDRRRSEVMHKLLNAFQQKVQACVDSFSPDLTLSSLKVVTSVSALKPMSKTPHVPASRDNHDGNRRGSRQSNSPPPIDPFSELDYEEAMTRELPIFTTSRLRRTIQQILRRATLRQDGSLYFPGASQTAMATKSVQYFIWYFEFMDYLQELHGNFVERIFTPMFKYFHDVNLLGSNGRTTTMSSALSKLSQLTDESLTDEEMEECESMDENSRMKTQAKTALKNLSNEYKDIKDIYDTSAVDAIAQRLSYLKEQIDSLLDEEDEVDPELYSDDSAKMIQHLDIDFGTENMLRFVPDILVKFRKAAWLVRRWLELDDQRTKDANEKLKKIASIEEKLVQRLDILKGDVSRREKLLEDETNELSHLMEREARSDELNVKSHDINDRIAKLQREIEVLKSERDSFASELVKIVKNKNLREYHNLKFRFESNKLQRYILERKLASLTYQRNLLKDDLNLELFIRPSLIHSSNQIQDDCERLEKVIRDQKEEMSTIKNALIPIQEDKTSLLIRVDRQLEESSRQGSARGKQATLEAGNAKYMRSVGLKNAQYLRSYTNCSIQSRLPAISSKRPMPSVSERKFLIKPFPVGNNRAARTSSPPVW